MVKQPRLSTKVCLGKIKITCKNLEITVPVDQSGFRGIIFEGLEKREMIALADEDYMFSVGVRKMPSGNECCANAVPADKS